MTDGQRSEVLLRSTRCNPVRVAVSPRVLQEMPGAVSCSPRLGKLRGQEILGEAR